MSRKATTKELKDIIREFKRSQGTIGRKGAKFSGFSTDSRKELERKVLSLSPEQKREFEKAAKKVLVGAAVVGGIVLVGLAGIALEDLRRRRGGLPSLDAELDMAQLRMQNEEQIRADPLGTFANVKQASDIAAQERMFEEEQRRFAEQEAEFERRQRRLQAEFERQQSLAAVNDVLAEI